MLTDHVVRPSRTRHAWLATSTLLLILVLVQGCALGGGSRRTGGSGLSQAAEEAKKEPEDQKKLKAGRPVDKDEDEVVVERETIVVERDGPTAAPYGDPEVSGEPRPRGLSSIYRRF